MQIALTVLGLGLVVVGLRDMFHTLLHPSGKGAISNAVMALVWKLSRRLHHRFGSAVGPGGMVTVVLLWVLLQGLGWALVYLPHLPQDFVYGPGVDSTRYNHFTEALYVSFVNLATLGYGDVVPSQPWVRLTSPLEALTGFALLTAALAWFTQVYPPLSRRHALALHLKGMADIGYATELPGLDPVASSRTLEALALDVAKASVDFHQHAESYYFQEDAKALSLAHQLPYALVLRDAGAKCSAPETRAAARMLGQSLHQLSDQLRESFVTADEDPDAVFAAYAADHGLEPRTLTVS